MMIYLLGTREITSTVPSAEHPRACDSQTAPSYYASCQIGRIGRAADGFALCCNALLCSPWSMA